MTPRIFSLIAAAVFLLIALAHTLRVLFGWYITVGNVVVPVWTSWIGLAIAGYLAYQGFRVSRRVRSEIRVFRK